MRPRIVRGVRLARHRRPTPTPNDGRPDRTHTGRRLGRGHGAGERPPVPRHRSPVHRDVVRLHGAGGHARAPEPPQEGPAVRARGANAPAGRRSSPRAAAGVRATPTAPGVAGLDCMAFNLFGGLSGLVPLVGDQLGPLLRGQRRAARLLRRRHRHRGLEHRHGRPRHDRRRRPRRVPSGRGRPDVGAGAERRRRHRRRRRGRGGRGGEAVPVVLPRAGTRVGVRGSAAPALRHPGEPAARLRHPQGHRDDGRHGLGARAATRLRSRDDHRARSASRVARSGSSPTTRCTSPARSRATVPTRPRASCSCATRSTSRSCSSATRPG